MVLTPEEDDKRARKSSLNPFSLDDNDQGKQNPLLIPDDDQSQGRRNGRQTRTRACELVFHVVFPVFFVLDYRLFGFPLIHISNGRGNLLIYYLCISWASLFVPDFTAKSFIQR
jgi:hypothetical protein